VEDQGTRRERSFCVRTSIVFVRVLGGAHGLGARQLTERREPVAGGALIRECPVFPVLGGTSWYKVGEAAETALMAHAQAEHASFLIGTRVSSNTIHSPPIPKLPLLSLDSRLTGVTDGPDFNSFTSIPLQH
jgi:hypothetical protein